MINPNPHPTLILTQPTLLLTQPTLLLTQVRAKALYAASGLLRACPEAQAQFIANDGLQVTLPHPWPRAGRGPGPLTQT